MSLDADVIVVGAGPAGSTAAALLAASGVRVLVVDRATFPRDKPCGDYCNPGAVSLLRDAGVLPAVFDTGASAISGMRVYAQDGSRFEARFRVGHGLLIPRLRLDAALLGHASRAGAAICEGVAVDSVRSHPDAVEVRTASGRRWRARLLIAADGMHSVIARRLGRLILPAAGRYTVGAYFSGLAQTAPGGELHLGPGWYGGVAHFGSGIANVCMALPRRLWPDAGPRPEVVPGPAAGRYTVGAYFSGLAQTAPGGELHLGPGWYGGVAHFGSGIANVCMALPRRLWRHAGPRQTFDAALTSLPALAEAMAGARRESRFRCSGPVGFADRNAVADRILLIGDAGGQIEPMTGQGIFLALRSAHLASGVAAEALSTDDLSYRKLFTYAQRRRREIAGRLAVSRWLQRLAFHPRMTPLLVRRLRMRAELAGDLLGATGDVLPPGGILSPAYLARLLL